MCAALLDSTCGSATIHSFTALAGDPLELCSCSPPRLDHAPLRLDPGRRRRRFALAATTYVDPRNGNQGNGQTTPAGTSKQLLAERPLCFYFCGEARGRRLSLIGVPLRFPFPEGSRPWGLEKQRSVRTSWIDMPPPRRTPSPPDTCKRVSTLVATPLARHRPRPFHRVADRSRKLESASLLSRFDGRQNPPQHHDW